MGLLDSLGAGIQGLLGNPDVRNSLLTSLAVTGPNSEERMALLMRQKAIQEEAKKAEELRQLQLEAYRRQMAQEDKLQQKDDITGAMIQSMNAQVADAVSRLRSSLSSNDMAGAQKARDELAALQSPEAQQIYRGHVATQGNPEMAMQAGLISPMSQAKATTAMRNVEALGYTPGTPEYQDALAALLARPASSVTVNNASGLPDLPKDYMWNDPSNPSLGVKPIPGGPADTSAKDNTRTGNRATKVQSTMQTVAEALRRTDATTAGALGAAAQFIPGTDARWLQGALRTVKANIGFDELQAMREASPTGGALGQVAVQELESLQSTIASLDQGLSPQDLEANLKKVQMHYQRWLDAVNQSKSGALPSSEASITQGSRDLSTYSEEELRAELERIQRGRQ